jgi:NAD(P)-dependent dehydrogenase (short-subunit alcohol dehydrogenase family)
MEIRRVAVGGAGVMGRSIATTFARGGFAVALVSRNPACLRRASTHGPPRHLTHTRAARSEAGFVPLDRRSPWDLAALRPENAGKLRSILEIANE